MNLSIIFQLVSLIWLISAKKYKCVFDEMYKDYKPHLNKGLSPDQPLTMHIHGRQMQIQSRTPINIMLDTSYFDTIKSPQNGASSTTFAHLSFISRAMQVAKQFYQARLQVTKVAKIKAPVECFDFNPPDSDVGDGVQADLLIYVRYITDKNSGYGATGISCKTFDATSLPDSTFQRGRPTVGRIIFNTYTLLQDQGITDDQALLTNRRFSAVTATAIHEAMHILGFNYALYDTYLDPRTAGTVYSSLIEGPINLHIKRPDSYLMKGPNVVAWAKQFFDCHSITGMQLQNEDGSTPGSHWERAIMYDQLMTGTQLGAQKGVSGVNFALLKDMGWYNVDGTFNDTTNFGYKKGCTFYTGICHSSTPPPKPFCDPTAQNGISYCSSTHLGKGVCSKQTGLMSDDCGLWQQYMHCVDPDQPDDGLQQQTIQQYGTSSFCVVGTMGRNAIPATSQSRCYPYTCSLVTGSQSILFQVGNFNITCLKAEKGYKKTLGALSGYIQCPDFDQFCVNSRRICKNWCSQRGFCMRGICNCLPGFSGDDCSKPLCLQTQYYNPLSNSCGTSCPSGYYQNLYSKTCMKCASSCQQCIGQPHICSSCHSTATNPLVFYNDNCYSSCPIGTYLILDKCYDCTTADPIFCKTCSGSATGCTSCQDTYFLQNPTQGTCNLNCIDPAYKLKDMVNFKCVQNCRDNLIQVGLTCVLCPFGQYKWISDRNCHTDCQSGFYKDDTERFCKQCDDACQFCDGGKAQNCTKCWTDRPQKYLLLKMCVSKCPSGYYQNDLSGACQVCSALNLNCASCYYDDKIDMKVKCSTCRYGYYYQSNNQTCLLNCDQYKYKNKWNHSCNACSLQCGDCTSPYESSCTNCRADKFFLSNQTGGYCLPDCPVQNYVKNGLNCLPCHKTCKTCNGISSADCITCATGLYFYNGYCRYVCPEKTFANSANYQCTTCNVNCTFCFGLTIDNCTSCVTSMVLNNNTCSDSCPKGMIVNQWKVCEKYDQNLKTIFITLILILVILFTN